MTGVPFAFDRVFTNGNAVMIGATYSTTHPSRGHGRFSKKRFNAFFRAGFLHPVFARGVVISI